MRKPVLPYHGHDYPAKRLLRGKNGEYEISIYTSCCNAAKGIYYYKTYDNSRIAGIDMHKEDFDGTKCVCYKPDKTDIFIQN